jgi:hypothetical protein
MIASTFQNVSGSQVLVWMIVAAALLIVAVPVGIWQARRKRRRGP